MTFRRGSYEGRVQYGVFLGLARFLAASDSDETAIIDMDMSYTRVLHIKVAYRVPHKLRHALYVTRPLLCARITCYVTVITVEINHCSFRRLRFALLYIVTRSKIV
jgi:Na+-translocating ferredoxin:NAD+ oxidoreductase RnfA subunit